MNKLFLLIDLGEEQIVSSIRKDKESTDRAHLDNLIEPVCPDHVAPRTSKVTRRVSSSCTPHRLPLSTSQLDDQRAFLFR
jgi:hypothetical protein